ncbi:phosphoribosyltransferase family protein [Streptomyces sp. NPDC090032]|uniref:phosphoribosyltransferase family protein n=1 Tax=Streptomyces sp. NPDC090032 TaxID=3365925 RepID=UPI0038155298
MRFTDRTDAGRRLAAAVQYLRDEKPVVLGLPRGGVPVAFEVARALDAPLDVIVVRKLGVPYQPELAFGAIGEGGVRVLNDDVVRHCGIDPEHIAAVERAERQELERRARRYRGGRPPAADEARTVTGEARTVVGEDRTVTREARTVIVVDDGIATGATAAAACQVVRAQGAARVVLAVPVAPPDAVHRLRAVADDVVCLSVPPLFGSVGEWYGDFSQTTDEEVAACLARAVADPARVRPAPALTEVEVEAAGVRLAGDLALPEGAAGLVMFAHGSGSSRHSPRNRAVAEVLQEAGLGTLLFDLLTPSEEADRNNVFDIGALAGRLAGATRWLREREPAPIGYFGASTGAAAALRAAADDPDIGAVVSRGGRPDLAGPRLDEVRAPTLLIVGGADTRVLDLNRAAQAQLRCENRLETVPGATHLFEEPGALDRVADLARSWFTTYLTAGSDPSTSARREPRH